MAQNFKLIYTPEGGSPKEWILDLNNPAWDITYATEKATDWPWGVFVDRIQNQSAIALRALLWVLRKRDEPRLALESVIPNMDEIDFAGLCPRCEEWIDDEGHMCSSAEPEQGDDEQAGDPAGEA